MSLTVNDISIKNCTCYLFNDNINIKNFDPNNIEIDEKSNKNIIIYYTDNVMMKNLK